MTKCKCVSDEAEENSLWMKWTRKWVRECMNERMNNLQNKWMSERVSEQKKGAYRQVNEWENERTLNHQRYYDPVTGSARFHACASDFPSPSPRCFAISGPEGMDSHTLTCMHTYMHSLQFCCKAPLRNHEDGRSGYKTHAQPGQLNITCLFCM